MALRISLVTPVLNQAEFLETALRSVHVQEYPNLEHVVMDGGSTDGTIDVLKRWEGRLSRWQSSADGGMYPALETAFSGMTGELMGWINADDILMPWALRTVDDIFANFPEVEWITTLQPATWDYLGFSAGVQWRAGYSREAFLDGRFHEHFPGFRGYIQQESTFWRRGLWERSGGLDGWTHKNGGDFRLWGRFFEHADLYGVSCPIGGFRVRDGQASGVGNEYANRTRTELEDLRRRAGWRRNPLRETAYRAGLDRIAGSNGIFAHVIGYPGRRLVREDIGRPQARWIIENYSYI